MPINLNAVANAVIKTAQALAEMATDDLVIINNGGIKAQGPYTGNERLTLTQFVAEYGEKAGIPAGITPTFTREGVGTVDGDDLVQPGEYQAIIDAKDNS
jgi:hypothetical protein